MIDPILAIEAYARYRAYRAIEGLIQALRHRTAMMAAEDFTQAIRQLQEQAGQPSEHLAKISQGILDMAREDQQP